MVKTIKVLFFSVCILVASFAIHGQASANTMEYPIRGEGAGEISGYMVSNLHFRLAEDPTLISAVDFDLDAPASEVLISFDSRGSFS